MDPAHKTDAAGKLNQLGVALQGNKREIELWGGGGVGGIQGK